MEKKGEDKIKITYQVSMFKDIQNSGKIIFFSLDEYLKEINQPEDSEAQLNDIIKYIVLNKIEKDKYNPDDYFAKCNLCGKMFDLKTKLNKNLIVCNHFNNENLIQLEKKYRKINFQVWDSSIQDTNLPHYYVIGPEGIKLLDKDGKKHLILGGPECSKFMYSEKDFFNINKFNVNANAPRGGFGVVKYCKSKDGQMDIAIKKIKRPLVEENPSESQHSSRGKETQYLRSIEREITIMNSSTSPNIVKMYFAYQNEDKCITERNFFIVMEYMNKGNLLQLLEEYPKFFKNLGDPKEAEEIIYCILSQVIEGILYMNFKLFAYHKDIKAENILYNDKGEVKLCDFGSSKFLEDPRIDREGFKISTLQPIKNIFSAPSIIPIGSLFEPKIEDGLSDIIQAKRMGESFLESNDLNNNLLSFNEEFIREHNDIYMIPLINDKKKYNEIKCDIWSFGILIYFLITGDKEKYDNLFEDDKYFVDENVQELINELQEEFKFSNELSELIKGCIVKQVDRRLGIKEVVCSSWFKKYSQKIKDRKIWFEKLKSKLEK